MKLSRIPGAEQTVKHSFSLKASTSNNLQAYHQMYCDQFGLDPKDVALKDIAEQILIDFMNGDKDFQRYLNDKSTKPVKPATAPRQDIAPPAAPRHDDSGSQAQSI
ncbi:DUF2274 domain-containing protein [Achromobacter anxifer]|uniref:DUF2274 domain-containing protein n=1 Tax=Achromobacter anxifer TaxID=1287737 RepID=UPI001591545B|nr:DUF2274 domain-containing protein [Achromobacter anxifer]